MERPVLLFEEFTKINALHESKEEDMMLKFLKEHRGEITAHSIEDGKLNCRGDIKIEYDRDLIDGKLPFKFGHIDGSFIISNCEELISLEGCPDYVNGSFDLSNLPLLKSLEYSPTVVMGYYLYECNGITSLDELALDYCDYFSIQKCKNIKNLKGLPQCAHGVNIEQCDGLKTLEGFPNSTHISSLHIENCSGLITLNGAPEMVEEHFSCKKCKNLSSLEGAPIECGVFNCNECDSLISLEGAPRKVYVDFTCEKCANLITLKGAPEEVGGSFKCNYCEKLERLEAYTKKVGEWFQCSGCEKLTSLIGSPENVKYFVINGGSFKTMEGAPKNAFSLEIIGIDTLISLEGCPESVHMFKCQKCKNLTSLEGMPKEIGNYKILVDECGKKFNQGDLPKYVSGSVEIKYEYSWGR